MRKQMIEEQKQQELQLKREQEFMKQQDRAQVC